MPVDDARGRRSIPPSAASARSTPSSACCCARARCSRCCCLRGPALDRRRDAGAPRQPGREPADGARSCCSSTIARSTSTPGAARPTTRSSGSIRCRPRAPTSCSRRCSATTPSLQPLKRLLIERTEGNPFFLEESVRDAGRDAGAGRRARRLPAGPAARRRSRCPATVQAVLAARIDRLPPEDKRLLQAAAVIGKDVPLSAAPGHRRRCPRTALRQGLTRLQAAEFLYETQPLPGAGVHLQARADPRGGLRQPAPGAAARAARPDRGGHRGAERRSPRRARRAARPPRPARRGLGEGRRLSPAGGRQGRGALGPPRGGRPPEQALELSGACPTRPTASSKSWRSRPRSARR